MRTARILAALAALAATTVLAACEPDLGDPASLVKSTRFLAVRIEPAEARPGDTVTLSALVVTPDGTIASAPVGWNVCDAPKPLSQNNVVADECLYSSDNRLPDNGDSVPMTLPTDACAHFGPDTPAPMPGQPTLRPRDADVTGGYYQPVRAIVKDPLGSGQTYVAAVALSRITCNLANAPVDVVVDFRNRYHANVNPDIERVLVSTDGATAHDLPATVAPGAQATFRVRWSPGAAETYPVFDVASRTLVDHRETMRVSWFSNAGELEHERTGRLEDETETFTDDVWTAPETPGTYHMWVVLRDSRGGADFRSFDVTVANAP
jgi:hypothetical protein